MVTNSGVLNGALSQAILRATLVGSRYTHTHTHMSTHMHTHMHTRTRTHTHDAHTHTCTHTRSQACARTHTHTHTDTHTHFQVFGYEPPLQTLAKQQPLLAPITSPLSNVSSDAIMVVMIAFKADEAPVYIKCSIFSKVLYMATLYSEYARALILRICVNRMSCTFG